MIIDVPLWAVAVAKVIGLCLGAVAIVVILALMIMAAGGGYGGTSSSCSGSFGPPSAARRRQVRLVKGGKEDGDELSGFDRIVSRSTYDGWRSVTVDASCEPLTLERMQAAWTRAFAQSCEAMGGSHLYAVKES